jgi:hypothetical protein
MFGKQLLEHVPLIAYICHGLEQDKSGDLPEDLFLKLLRFTLSEEEAERALRVAIEWGRYGDLFEYNFNTGVIQSAEETSRPRIEYLSQRAHRAAHRLTLNCSARLWPASSARFRERPEAPGELPLQYGSGAAFDAGVEEILFEGVSSSIFCSLFQPTTFSQ